MGRPKKQQPEQRTISRRVFFYRVDAGLQPDTGQPRKINLGPAVRHLDTLPFNVGGRYLNTSDGKQLCCWVDSLQLPYRFRLANIRRGQHPPVEDAGKFSPLVLGAGKGLAEITHLVLFPDDVCGVEFNFYGPRASQLPFYFALKLNGICPGFKLNTITRPDLESRLASLSDIKLLDLKVRASFASILAEADQDLGAALQANIKAVRARPEDEFELKFVRKKNKGLVAAVVPAALLEGVRRLARNPQLKEQVSIFKVTGVDGSQSQLMDILNEQFVAEKPIQPAADEANGVDSESMYKAIEEAYSDIREQLSTARVLG